MNTIWRWKLPSNLLHGLIPNRFSHSSEPFMGQRTGTPSMYAFFLCTDGRVGYEGVPPSSSVRKPLKSCQLLNLDQQKAKAAGTPSGTWYPLLCFGNSSCRRGTNAVVLADTFLLCQHSCWKLSAFHYTWKLSKWKRSCLPFLLCVMPSTVWVVNKCHITFIPLTEEMMFSKESCC